MLKNKSGLALAALVLVGSVLAACASPTPAATPEPTEAMTEAPATAAPTEAMTEAPTATAEATQAASGDDLLAEIQKRGTLVISTDPNYAPQSSVVEGAQRNADTKCAGDQHTANEFKGFDIDVAVAIAKGLNVEPCFVTPDWTLITAGSWAGRWDISVGSMSITPERTKLLYFSQPYYTTPAAVFVAKDAAFTQPSDLSGKTVGACTGCTYDSYLSGSLEIPGEKIDFVIKNVNFKGYDTDKTAIQDLVAGRIDGVLTAQPTGQDSIANGQPIKQLGDPLFFEYLSAAFDKSSDKDAKSLVAKVSEIIQGMHKDGTLKTMSQTVYNTDLTTSAAQFDISLIGQ